MLGDASTRTDKGRTGSAHALFACALANNRTKLVRNSGFISPIRCTGWLLWQSLILRLGRVLAPLRQDLPSATPNRLPLTQETLCCFAPAE